MNLTRRIAHRAKLNRRTVKAETALLLKFALGFVPADVEGLQPRRPSKQRGVQRWFHPTGQGPVA